MKSYIVKSAKQNKADLWTVKLVAGVELGGSICHSRTYFMHFETEPTWEEGYKLTPEEVECLATNFVEEQSVCEFVDEQGNPQIDPTTGKPKTWLRTVLVPRETVNSDNDDEQ